MLSINGSGCTVEVDGARIEALAVNVPGAGAPTTLSLRPERVRIDPPEAACHNLFEAQVEELIYLGDHIRARVRLCGNEEFVVKVPNAEGRPALDAGSTDPRRMEEGGLPGARRGLEGSRPAATRAGPSPEGRPCREKSR